MPTESKSAPKKKSTSEKKSASKKKSMSTKKSASATENAPEKERKPAVSKTKRAGLVIPVARVGGLLRSRCRGYKIGVGASVYLSAVLEYLITELSELAADAAKDHKKQRILPRHLMLAIRYDNELSVLLRDVVLPQGGVKPNINSVLLPKKTQKTKKRVVDEEMEESNSTDEKEEGIPSQEF